MVILQGSAIKTSAFPDVLNGTVGVIKQWLKVLF